jgi:hypothetical protein
MELKNAAAVCLISLCSATLVVLIARALDSQAAGQLEPRLIEIADELRAIRRQGVTRVDDAAQQENVGDGLVVYYFHSDARCPSCQAVEAGTKETLDADFAPQLGRGEIVWKVLNYTKPSGAVLAMKFDVKDPVVVLARMKDDRVSDWRRLDKVLAMAADKPALTKYVRGEIEQMLASEKKSVPAAAQGKGPTIPVPAAKGGPAKKTPAIPVPR